MRLAKGSAAFVSVTLVGQTGGVGHSFDFADLWGGRRLDTHTAVYANGELFEAVMAAIATAIPQGDGAPDPLT